MNLPEDKGTYVLVSSVSQPKRLEVGRLGAFDLAPGCYAYVGSAFGAGGLRARLGHHLQPTAAPHWHIDYLLTVAAPVAIWFSTATHKLEHHWVGLLEKAPRFCIPIPRFGSSDSHRHRSSHLFFCKRRPSFRWFEQQLRQHCKGVQAERYAVPAPPVISQQAGSLRQMKSAINPARQPSTSCVQAQRPV